MSKEQIWERLARIQTDWERCYAAKNWAMCSKYKRYYDTLWAGWTGK